MNLKVIKIDKSKYQIIDQNHEIGEIDLYRNLFHDSCIYLKFNLKYYPLAFPFSEIKRIEKKPLQVMAESSQIDLTNFLLRNNFICKRKCYEARVSVNNLKTQLHDDHQIYKFAQDSKYYERLCQQLYYYYKKVHQNVSPLTATFQDFLSDVPTKTGFFDLNEKNQIQNIIFTEENEIAYAVSQNLSSFSSFKEAVLDQLFNQYNEIFFEADDVDLVAMNLLHTFDLKLTDSFNTYIFKS